MVGTDYAPGVNQATAQTQTNMGWLDRHRAALTEWLQPQDPPPSPGGRPNYRYQHSDMLSFAFSKHVSTIAATPVGSLLNTLRHGSKRSEGRRVHTVYMLQRPASTHCVHAPKAGEYTLCTRSKAGEYTLCTHTKGRRVHTVCTLQRPASTHCTLQRPASTHCVCTSTACTNRNCVRAFPPPRWPCG